MSTFQYSIVPIQLLKMISEQFHFSIASCIFTSYPPYDDYLFSKQFMWGYLLFQKYIYKQLWSYTLILINQYFFNIVKKGSTKHLRNCDLSSNTIKKNDETLHSYLSTNSQINHYQLYNMYFFLIKEKIETSDIWT